MTVRVIVGDALDVLPTLESESVSAIVTDPPAGISFMGRDWDHNKGGRDAWVAWLADVLRECWRVAKPGAHAVVWSLPRTSGWTHRALEDAGWEIRDCVVHLFGSGFPKSLDVGKALDKMAGAERLVLPGKRHERYNTKNGTTFGGSDPRADHWNIPTAPATDLARQWDGWGTALKPAAEFWYLARKPFRGSVVSCVATHGTGALNIDATRIGTADDLNGGAYAKQGSDRHDGTENWRYRRNGDAGEFVQPSGRWPANVVLSHLPECREIGTRRVKSNARPNVEGQDGNAAPFWGGGGWKPVKKSALAADADGMETVAAWDCHSDCPVRLLDEQAGERPTSAAGPIYAKASIGYGGSVAEFVTRGYGDTGGVSRFFGTFAWEPGEAEATRFRYEPKADTSERTLPDGSRCSHPTQKPLSLMNFLVKLVTPPGGTVLDPFCGSGSTLIAADRLGFDAIGIEQDEGYAREAEARCRGDAPLFADVEVVR